MRVRVSLAVSTWWLVGLLAPYLCAQAPPVASARPDPIFWLAGEPGAGSATGSAPGFGPALRRLFPNRDLVFVDQRRTGASNGVFCGNDRPERAEDVRALFGAVFDPNLTRRCAAELSARVDLRRYTTIDAVDDLDAVRSALAYEMGTGGARETPGRVAPARPATPPGDMARARQKPGTREGRARTRGSPDHDGLHTPREGARSRPGRTHCDPWTKTGHIRCVRTAIQRDGTQTVKLKR